MLNAIRSRRQSLAADMLCSGDIKEQMSAAICEMLDLPALLFHRADATASRKLMIGGGCVLRPDQLTTSDQ